MTTSESRIRGIAELIALIPHKLGYHPRSSLVVVCINLAPAGSPGLGSIGLIVRIDLPAPGEEQEAVDALLEAVARHAPHTVEIVAFEEGDDDASDILEWMARGCHGLQIVADNLVRVRAGRYLRSFEPDGSRPGWRELPTPVDVPAAADLVLRGAAPFADRADLERLLDGDGAPGDPVVLSMFFQRLDRGWPLGGADHRSRAAAVWGRALAAPDDPRVVDELSDEDLTDLLVSLLDIGFRDSLLATLAPGQFAVPELSGELLDELDRELEGVLDDGTGLLFRLAALVGRTPAELAGPIATLLGVVSWSQGEGTLANIAVERALTATPGYRLAGLLELALARAVPPWGRTRDSGSSGGEEPGRGNRLDPHQGVA